MNKEVVKERIKIDFKLGFIAIIIMVIYLLFVIPSPALNYSEPLNDYEIIKVELGKTDDEVNYYNIIIRYTLNDEKYISEVELLNSKFENEFNSISNDNSAENVKEVLGILYYNKGNPTKIIKKGIEHEINKK